MNIVDLTKSGCRDISDAWFQLLFKILEEGSVHKIDEGSYAGQKRLEFDYVTVKINYPGTIPLLPQIPEHYGIPNPVADDYLDEYLPYLMTADKKPGESYTYGERLTKVDTMEYWLNLIHYKSTTYMNEIYYGSDISSHEAIDKDKTFGEKIMYRDEDQSTYEFLSDKRNIPAFFLNQIEYIINAYKTKGFHNNQLVLQVAQPSDLILKDPPCLRHIDTRIQDNTLHFFVYFRSWDLWGGFPANLAAIEMLKQYMAAEIGVESGEIIAASKGLHLYDYSFDIAKCLRMRDDMKLEGE